MRSYTHKPIGILYEHAEQFNPLFNSLNTRGIPYVTINPADHFFNPLEVEIPYSLLFTDLSTPLYCHKSIGAVSLTIEYLRHLEVNNKGSIRGRLVNGSQAVDIMTSVSKQLSVFASMGLPFPKTFIVSSLNQLLSVVDELKFPILIKQNMISSPHGTIRIDSMVELIESIGNDAMEPNGSNLLLIQEYIRPKGNYSIRVETLNGRVVQAVRIFVTGDQVKAWPIIVKKEPVILPQEISKVIEKIAHAARLEVGSIEFLTDASTNKPVFFGIRPHVYATGINSENEQVHTVEMVATYIQKRLLKIMEIELAI